MHVAEEEDVFWISRSSANELTTFTQSVLHLSDVTPGKNAAWIALASSKLAGIQSNQLEFSSVFSENQTKLSKGGKNKRDWMSGQI